MGGKTNKKRTQKQATYQPNLKADVQQKNQNLKVITQAYLQPFLLKRSKPLIYSQKYKSSGPSHTPMLVSTSSMHNITHFFRKNHSASTILTNLTNTYLRTLKSSPFMQLVTVNINKAFDMVPTTSSPTKSEAHASTQPTKNGSLISLHVDLLRLPKEILHPHSKVNTYTDYLTINSQHPKYMHSGSSFSSNLPSPLGTPTQILHYSSFTRQMWSKTNPSPHNEWFLSFPHKTPTIPT